MFAVRKTEKWALPCVPWSAVGLESNSSPAHWKLYINFQGRKFHLSAPLYPWWGSSWLHRHQPLLISAHKAQRDDFIGLQTFLMPSFKVGPALRQRQDQMTLQHPLQPKLVCNSVISVLSGRNSDGNTHKLLKVKDRYDPSLSHSKIN